MTSSENISISSSDPDKIVPIPISDYAKKLDVKVRERCLKKISTIGIDPDLIEGKRFEPDCLPPVESTNLLYSLVLETSFYTQKQFKSFRGLEAYNQMVSAFVSNVQGHIMSNKFVVSAKSAALSAHERRVATNLDYYEKDGTIHCKQDNKL